MSDFRDRDIELPIGIVGAGGDMGRRLTTELRMSSHDVVAFEAKDELREGIEQDDAQELQGVYPGLGGTYSGYKVRERGNLTVVESPEEVIEEVDVVHFTVPDFVLADVPRIDSDPTRIGVGHVSVMALSEQAISGRPDSSQFTIIHFLMNEHGRVLVSPDHGNVDGVKAHLKEAGTDPKEKNIQEADREGIAQAMFALLIEAGLKDVTDASYAEGDLPPSAEELMQAFANRESAWTDDTRRALLANPALASFVEGLPAILRNDSGTL